jgi:hypothetical protein
MTLFCVNLDIENEISKIYKNMLLILEKNEMNNIDKLEFKRLYKIIKMYFTIKKSVSEEEKEFIKNLKEKISLINNQITKKLTKDEKEYNRLFTKKDEEDQNEINKKLITLIKKDLKVALPKNLKTLEDYSIQKARYQEYKKIFDENNINNGSEKILLEIGRKLGILKYEDAEDVYKIRELGDAKMSSEIYKYLVKENNIVNKDIIFDKEKIIENLVNKKFVVGILELKDPYTIILKPEQKHILLGIEDPDDKEKIIILGYLTNQQPFVSLNEKNDKSQYFHYNNKLYRILQSDFKEVDNGNNYITSVLDIIKNLYNHENNQFKIIEGLPEINKDKLIKYIKIAIENKIKDIENYETKMGDRYKGMSDDFKEKKEKSKKEISNKMQKKEEDKVQLSKEEKYIKELIELSENRQNLGKGVNIENYNFQNKDDSNQDKEKDDNKNED